MTADLAHEAHGPLRAVFFDYDGVLTTDPTGSVTTCGYLSQASGLPFDVLAQAFRPHNAALSTGRCTHAEVWPAICAQLPRPLPIEWLRAAFESTPLNAAMMALARGLKQCGLVVGIITDNKQDRIDHLVRHQGLAALFDPIVVSAAVGSTKEGAAIFEHALQRAGLPAAQCLFIDNSPANLVAAARLGMHSEHFDDARADVAGLADLLRSRYRVPLAPAPEAQHEIAR